MFILFHVLIALSSVVYTGYTSFFPSKKKLYVAYALVGLTIATGTYLIISLPAHMISTCFEGLVYIGIVTVGLVFAKKRLRFSTPA